MAVNGTAYSNTEVDVRSTVLFLVNVTAIAISCFLAEIYLRVDGHKPYVRTTPGQYQNDPNAADWAQLDPVLGWTSKKDNPEINQQGFRDAKDFVRNDLGSSRTRVMVLGDSFMWGARVGRDENVPNLLQIKLKDKYAVFNLSAPGWGIDQMYLAYQQYKDVLDPHLIILAFIDDDVDRVLEAYRRWEGYNKPSFTLKDGQLVSRPIVPPIPHFLNKISEHSVLVSTLMHEFYLAADARPIVKHIFLDTAQDAQQRKAQFVVVRIPTHIATKMDRFLNNFETIFKDTGVLYLDPSAEMATIPNWLHDLYVSDGHMSPAGNQYIANYIYQHVFHDSQSRAGIL